MSIVSLILIVLFLGFCAWCIYRFGTEIPSPFKTLCLVILFVVAVLYTLSAFGVLGSLNAPVPRVGSGLRLIPWLFACIWGWKEKIS